MRKILCFLILLILFSAKPTSAAGQDCCSGGFILNGSLKCEDPNGLEHPNNCESVGQSCDPTTGPFGTCIGSMTIGPSCPAGSKGIEDLPGCSALEKQFPDYKKRFCCKESWFGLSCALKNGTWWGSGVGGLATCNDVMLVLRDSCPGQNWRLNSTAWTCEQFAATPWEAKLVPCGSAQGINTAIGCVPTDNLKGLLGFVLKFALLASGGIILLMTIATGFTIITSGGNPEKLQAAKENIVALFSGLLLIAFSLVLLQTIGADILNLPTFIR